MDKFRFENRLFVRLAILVLFSTFLLSSLPVAAETDSGTSRSGKELLVGVKIYQYSKSYESLFEKWKSLGINTAFAGAELVSDKMFMKTARLNATKVFLISPTFYNPDVLKKHPEWYAVTGEGKKAIDEWVEFVCPNREQYRRQHLETVGKFIAEHQPDGLSIDFIRYFAFWEKVYPDAQLDPIQYTCFCPGCLETFQKKFPLKIPVEAVNVGQKAAWLLSNHQEKWVQWKCDVITSMVKSIVETARKIKPDILINLHVVPWRRGDFDGASRRIIGQDIAALSPYVDYFSPMCYAHMVKREPSWVHEVVADLAGQTKKPILPSIQVTEAYLKEKLTVNRFKQDLIESLKPPSAGVVFWNWKYLEADTGKREATGTRQ